MLQTPLHVDEMTRQQMLTIWIQKGQHLFVNANPYKPKFNSFVQLQGRHSNITNSQQ